MLRITPFDFAKDWPFDTAQGRPHYGTLHYRVKGLAAEQIFTKMSECIFDRTFLSPLRQKGKLVWLRAGSESTKEVFPPSPAMAGLMAGYHV